MAEIGRKPGEVESPGAETGRWDCDSQVVGSARLVAEAQVGQYATPDQNVAEVFDQPPPGAGQKPPRLSAAIQDGLALIDDARPPRNLGGRPRTIDDVAKIKIATLLATGVSLRQVAGFLGVSHSTVSAAIAADPALKQEIDAARQRALLHPLACIVRESGRNWKAAVWLMEYLNKQAKGELSAEERNRQVAEEKAAVWIQNDLAGEIQQLAKTERQRQRQCEEDEQWRQEIAARKARKLARAAREQPSAAGAPITCPPRAASSS